MTALVWDQTGERLYETGVDHGVLYMPDSGGAYSDGVAWNGLTSVSETPSGAEPNSQYADNIKYLNLYSAEEFGATLEAFTYPDEFAQFDGLWTASPGVTVGQQSRKVFGLSYRTKIGNDIEGDDFGYKIHLIYGCTASPSEKAYNTINDSPEAITFSWEISTVPVGVTDHKPTSVITIDSTKVASAALADLEELLYGTVGTDPSLPSPDEVVALFGGTVTEVTPTQPTFDGSDTITIPTVTGVTYYIGGAAQVAGAVTITANTVVEARPNAGYSFPPTVDDDWLFVYVP
ncbi:MAG: hypothetical protein ABWY25_12100 [Paenisporosarcina sp.]